FPCEGQRRIKIHVQWFSSTVTPNNVPDCRLGRRCDQQATLPQVQVGGRKKRPQRQAEDVTAELLGSLFGASAERPERYEIEQSFTLNAIGQNASWNLTSRIVVKSFLGADSFSSVLFLQILFEAELLQFLLLQCSKILRTSAETLNFVSPNYGFDDTRDFRSPGTAIP